jgi:iron(III) transport system ATP-binding protein
MDQTLRGCKGCRAVTLSTQISQDGCVEALPFLRLRGIAKQFDRVAVLRRIDLDVPRGSFTCLVGPSGCGKTTLLRVLCGLEAADAGTIICDGLDITQQPAASRHMGLVFQSYALFPNLRVEDNVAYGLSRRLSRSELRCKVDALLEVVGLSGYGHRKPNELSGGQQQRVAIARALAPEPSVLLLDEPLSALDAQLRLQLRGELQELQKRLGITVVMVTHDQSEALAIADRIAVMQSGWIEQLGTPFDLYCHPANRFVAGFVGRMNFLTAVVAGAGSVRLPSGKSLPLNTGSLPRGTTVELGIRPENIALEPGAGDGIALRLRLLVREFLGASMRLEGVHEDSGTEIALDMPLHRGMALQAQTHIEAFLPATHLQLFSATT